jgi:hypothetical protein
MITKSGKFVMMGRKPKSRWWYSCDGHDFGIFKYAHSFQSNERWNVFGPFKSLELAKADAIDRYKADINMAKENIRAVRNWKPSWE